MMWEIWVLLVIAVVLLAGILVVEVLQWLVAAGLWAEVKQRRRARRKRRQR
jgi:preprotein translocase subunit SecF